MERRPGRAETGDGVYVTIGKQMGSRWIVAAALALVGAGSLAWGAWRAPRHPLPFVHAGEPAAAPGPAEAGVLPDRGGTVVVFAAHPDDEALGAGGVIHAAAHAGARVVLVFLTNGDGYLRGVDAMYHTVLSTPAHFVRFGEVRQREALTAAARLGVPEGNVVFLGYPDRGLAALWGPRRDCRTPLRSPYTRRDRSPYVRTYRPHALYCGGDVLADVRAILDRERPAVVITHHPADTHRDHWAAQAFVTLALERAAAAGEPWARRVRAYRFIVHSGAWPVPRAFAPALDETPPAVPGAAWVRVRLGREDEEAKHQALLAYRSQTALQRAYVLSFVRRSEVFDPLRAGGAGHITPGAGRGAPAQGQGTGGGIRNQTATAARLHIAPR